MIGTNFVYILQNQDYVYPDKSELFRPSCDYPEYMFPEHALKENRVYDTVRRSLFYAGLDSNNYGKQTWNPLGELISPGMTVLIKPNLVLEVNKSGAGTECLFTQPAVVAPIIDFAIKALKGQGKIVIGDAPVQECNFQKLIENSGYFSLIQYYRNKGINIELVDFRGASSVEEKGIYYLEDNVNVEGKVVDIGTESEFYSLQESLKSRLRITNYNPDKVTYHHQGKKNEYFISSYLLDADVVINMPKPKTHRIAGMTGALKNFVGINVRKEYLPHHTIGNHRDGGDESDANGLVLRMRAFCMDKKNKFQEERKFCRAKFWLNGVRLFSFLMNKISNNRDGCWYGNNTISKTIVDINRIVYFADKEGCLQDVPQRKILIIGDMIVGGEGNGPMQPTPKNAGYIVVGSNPVCFDETVAKLMGFDRKKLPTLALSRFSKNDNYSFVDKNLDPIICSDKKALNCGFESLEYGDLLHFVPSAGWVSHIEIDAGVQ